MPMATKAPMRTIHHGMVAGRLKASSTPVTTADQLPTVVAPRTMNRWIRYSDTTQAHTDSAVMKSTFAPNTTAETTNAGSRAMTTSRMMHAVERSDCTWGEGAMINL